MTDKNLLLCLEDKRDHADHDRGTPFIQCSGCALKCQIEAQNQEPDFPTADSDVEESIDVASQLYAPGNLCPFGSNGGPWHWMVSTRGKVVRDFRDSPGYCPGYWT